MNPETDENIIDNFFSFIRSDSSVCVGAKGALAKNNIRVMVAEYFDSSDSDGDILNFAYNFIRDYRKAEDGLHSLVIIFKEPVNIDEAEFEKILWRRLQSLSELDATKFAHDKRVSSDPASPTFSYSLMEEAFFIIALHPASSRMARRFSYPALVFNPHAQFEKMKQKGTYQKLDKTRQAKCLGIQKLKS